jgi:hypothetical protein
MMMMMMMMVMMKMCPVGADLHADGRADRQISLFAILRNATKDVTLRIICFTEWTRHLEYGHLLETEMT